MNTREFTVGIHVLSTAYLFMNNHDICNVKTCSISCDSIPFHDIHVSQIRIYEVCPPAFPASTGSTLPWANSALFPLALQNDGGRTRAYRRFRHASPQFRPSSSRHSRLACTVRQYFRWSDHRPCQPRPDQPDPERILRRTFSSHSTTQGVWHGKCAEMSTHVQFRHACLGFRPP